MSNVSPGSIEFEARVNSMQRSGSHASRPAAGSVVAGTAYFETDTNMQFRCDGTSWIQIGVTLGQPAIPDLAMGTLVVLADVITGMGTLQTKINTLLAELRAARIISP